MLLACIIYLNLTKTVKTARLQACKLAVHYQKQNFNLYCVYINVYLSNIH